MRDGSGAGGVTVSSRSSTFTRNVQLGGSFRSSLQNLAERLALLVSGVGRSRQYCAKGLALACTEIKERAHTSRAMQIAVGEQRVLRCQLWNVVDSSDKLGLAIPDGDRHRRETSSRFHRRDNGGPTVAASGDRRVRRYGSEPSRGGIICDCAIERHHEMTVDILKALGPPVALDIRTTGVYSPARGRERAADEGLVPGLAYSNRNVILSFGQIEKLVAQQEFEPKAGVACVKGVDEGCFKEAIGHRGRARDAEHAGKLFVPRSRVSLERGHSPLDLLGQRPQFLSKLGKPIASDASL